jgi:hypothetical protein
MKDPLDGFDPYAELSAWYPKYSDTTPWSKPYPYDTYKGYAIVYLFLEGKTAHRPRIADEDLSGLDGYLRRMLDFYYMDLENQVFEYRVDHDGKLARWTPEGKGKSYLEEVTYYFSGSGRESMWVRRVRRRAIQGFIPYKVDPNTLRGSGDIASEISDYTDKTNTPETQSREGTLSEADLTVNESG